MIQLRNVPDTLHRKLKARAAQAGMSLSDYLLAEFQGNRRAPDAQRIPGTSPQAEARLGTDRYGAAGTQRAGTK